MSTPSSCTAFVVERTDTNRTSCQVRSVDVTSLPAGNVTLRARWSSMNYKDALAATGHPGVVRKFPHVPGIDVAGEIIDLQPTDRPSTDAMRHLALGDEVLVTGYELGAGRWGGWSQIVRVPAEWVVKRPVGLSLAECMQIGTAGFTAALSVDALIHHGISPVSGDVAVTGASGGVGCLAVKLLARLGFRVVAATGKVHLGDQLRSWGAAEVVGRDAVLDASDKPLLMARWSGAVDTVGGATLATLIRQSRVGACVTACGLVGGTQLPLSVYPFILRGVTLAGIDSASTPLDRRQQIWHRLANEWRLGGLDEITTRTTLADVGGFVPRILAGEIIGRTLVEIP